MTNPTGNALNAAAGDVSGGWLPIDANVPLNETLVVGRWVYDFERPFWAQGFAHRHPSTGDEWHYRSGASDYVRETGPTHYMRTEAVAPKCTTVKGDRP